MFELTNLNDRPGLTSDKPLNSSDFRSIAGELATAPLQARKVGFIAANRADETQMIETSWNGSTSKATAKPGDYIAANLAADKSILRDGDGNASIYVIKADIFPALYQLDTGENEFGTMYKAISQVEALFLPAGFQIMAPWGEMQRADSGYLLLNNGEVYGNPRDTFEATYVII